MSGVDKAQPEHVPARRRSKASARLRGRGVDVVTTPKGEEELQQPKLPRHRWFEPERRPASERAQAVVDDVLNQVQNYERYKATRKRRRSRAHQETFEAMVTAVVCDLMFNHLSGEEPGIAITRSKAKLGKKSRYSSPVMSKTLPRLLDNLSSSEMDWLRQDLGSQEMFKESRATTIYPTDRLISRIEEHKVQVDDIAIRRYRETIVLKRPKDGPRDSGGYIEYADTDVTRRYRAQMDQINQFLDRADIDFLILSDPPVDSGKRQLRRVFTNGSFESGGRLFGGFWLDLSKEDRREELIIDEESIVTLD